MDTLIFVHIGVENTLIFVHGSLKDGLIYVRFCVMLTLIFVRDRYGRASYEENDRLFLAGMER